jgi:hypothetical protein
MSRIRLSLLSLLAVFAFSVVAATAAQAEKPVWLVKKGGVTKVLAAGETRKITSKKALAPAFKLSTATVTIECKKFKNTGEIIGGKPGRDLTTITFEECSVEGKTVAECGASNTATAGVIEVTGVKTALNWDGWTGQRTNADEAFFAANANNIFVEFKLSGTNCGLLQGETVKVKAIGSEVKELGGEAFGPRRCGVIGAVGKIVAGPPEAFERTIPKEIVRKGALSFTGLEKEEIEEKATGYEKIECKLEAPPLGAAKLTGTALVEPETAGEEFGFE